MLGNDSWEYCELLKSQLQIANVSIEKLSEGLCSPSMLSRICNGERTVNKMMRDRLMQRLGLADDRNENFIFREEYEKWKIRQKIVVLINEEDLVVAEELLDTYEKDISNKVEQQFCQVMRIQILQMREPGAEKIGKLYENALKLTVPHIDEKNVNELQLSAQELDLVLEYINYCHPDKLDSRCEELIEYVEKSAMDEQCIAKIMPKIVYYQCKKSHDMEQVDYVFLLRKCNVAIEYLRDAKRLFFLWELLQEREWLYDKLINELEQKEEYVKGQTIHNLRDENAQWLDAIQEVYFLSKVDSEMKNSCHLYLEKSTNCINDVIRKRRMMLGMTKKQLSEGICSEKTIGRLENKGGKAQLLIVKELFGKMRMSGEYQRQDIVTGNSEAYQILERIVKYGNDKAYDVVLTELVQLEKMIPMEELVNQQYVKRQRAVTNYLKGKCSKEETLKELHEAMALTISYEIVAGCENPYLTHGEMTCIQNMALVQGKEQMNAYYGLLTRLCEEYEVEDVVSQNISMYEFVMSSFASVLGNIGKYEMSDTLSKKIIRECVICRRLGRIVSNMYSIAWNYKEKGGELYSAKMWRRSLIIVATLFRIEKNFNSEIFILKKVQFC